MVTRAERLSLAGEVADALRTRHGPDDLLAIGLHGSVARGDDDGASDIDIAVITTHDAVQVPDRIRRVRGVIVDVGAITADAYLAEARRIGPAWPVASDQYLATHALHDPTGYFPLLARTHREAVATAPDEDFAEAAAFDLAQAWDALAGARRYLARPELPAARVALHDATVAIALTLGLLRRRTETNTARLVASVATDDWGLPSVTGPVARALAAGTAPAAHAALEAAFEALRAVCVDARIPWDADDVQGLIR
jgi:predicted nucleotidyltransferase